jgi:hypothetical protein
MSGVFQNIDPHPLTARRVCTPAFGAGGGHTRWAERGWGVNIMEDARHCSVPTLHSGRQCCCGTKPHNTKQYNTYRKFVFGRKLLWKYWIWIGVKWRGLQTCIAVLRIRDVYSGSLIRIFPFRIRIFPFRIPDPGSKRSQIWIRIKEFNYY